MKKFAICAWMQIAVICKIKTNISKIRKAFPPFFQLNFRHCICVAIIHHFGIAKRKVMGSKLQVTPTKLQVTPTKLQVTLAKLQVTPTKLQVGYNGLIYVLCQRLKTVLDSLLPLLLLALPSFWRLVRVFWNNCFWKRLKDHVKD